MKELSEEVLYEAFAKVYGCNRRFEGGYMAEYTQVRFNAFKFGAEWRDAEHAAALTESQRRVAELEAEVESLRGGVHPRSMRMNNRSLRMK